MRLENDTEKVNTFCIILSKEWILFDTFVLDVSSTHDQYYMVFFAPDKTFIQSKDLNIPLLIYLLLTMYLLNKRSS